MAITQQHMDETLAAVEHEGNPVLHIAPLSKSVPGVPPDWAKVLSSPNARTEVLKILWDPMAPRFKRTLRVLKRSLQGVGLLTTDAYPPSIIYFLTMESNGEPFFYRGFVPAAKLFPKAKNLPEDFTQFYRIHDGWIDQLESMGPLPVRDCHLLGKDPKQPSGKFFVVFYGNGGDRLGYDLGQTPPLCYVLAGGDPPPRVVPNVWTEIDKWVSIQLDGLLPYLNK